VTGETIEDVRASVKIAIEMHVDGMSPEALAEAETLGDFAELLEAGPPVPEEAHWALLRRDRLVA
jgi:predicted RNase H-like HicB family nuclease